MKALIVAIVLMACGAFAAEEQNPLAELDAKITKSLASDKWNEASKAFVRAIWADFTNAHAKAAQDLGGRGLQGRLPDAKSPDEYVGAYTGVASAESPDVSRPSPRAPSLTISRSEDGRLFVELEGRRIPAVFSSRSILCTTGDIVFSVLPNLGAKPYCTLEMFMLLRSDGKYYFAAPGVPPDKWREMVKKENAR